MPKTSAAALTVPQQHPFVKAFPQLAAGVMFGAAVLRTVLAVTRWWWPWRRELSLVVVLFGLWTVIGQVLPADWAFGASVLLEAGVIAIPSVRRWLTGWLRCSRTRRQVVAGLTETRAANPSGRLPRIKSVKVTAIGEQLVVHARPGHSAELLDARVEELRASARCRELRVTRDPNLSHRITFDVVRRDPLANSRDIPWAGMTADVLSMWDPITLGIDENGLAMRLSLVERGLIGGGEPGSGKSSLLSVILAHAAKSPDVHMVLIDPNEVQFAPWRNRALAFASDDPVDALAVLDLVRDEVRRRLKLLRDLPGVVRKVTPEIAREHNLPLWLVAIDELAFHTSVVGSPAQQKLFGTFCRDVVARSRAAGVIPVMFTQRPTSDVVPTSLRDLFSVRCAFRTTTKASSDVILGEGWSRQGYSATDIDIEARGVGWLLAEGQQPKRFKGAWLPDDTIGGLAVSTLPHRPPPPPPYTDPALDGLGEDVPAAVEVPAPRGSSEPKIATLTSSTRKDPS